MGPEMRSDASAGPPGTRPAALSGSDARALVDVSADGLIVADDRGRVRWMNAAARQALGPGPEHSDVTSLSRCTTDPGHLTDPDGVRRTTWVTRAGRRRHLDFRARALDGGGTAIWLTDVTEPVRQQERMTAIMRAAGSVADTYSLRATLDAVAHEIARTEGIAAVQIHAFGDPQAEVRLLGMAGFGDAGDFTRRLAECRRLGVRMLSIESFIRRERVVSPHRKSAIMTDPAWAPLHEIMGRPDWDTFVAVPLCVRGRVLGAVNAYYEVGEDPGPASLAFLEAMADHVALAMDTATLLSDTRSRARSEERRRLARDLHDSAVQQVFSMRMQAEALLAQFDAASFEGADANPMQDRVAELAGLATHALADLRDLLFEMRPFDLVQGGLVEAVRASVHGVETRHGLAVEVHVQEAFDVDLMLGVDVQEDLFRIIQEALHNVVKHACATSVTVSLLPATACGYDLMVEVVDDGCPTTAAEACQPEVEGFGLISMRERADRWDGRIEAGPHPDGGWRVRAYVPARPGDPAVALS